MITKPETRLPYFLFQLVAIRTTESGIEVTEVETISLITKPSSVGLDYRGGSKKLPMPDGFFSDEGGVIGTTIQISGASGVEPRRDGMQMVGGWERLKAFREKIFKLSHMIDENKAAQILYAMSSADLANYAKARQIVGADVVYAVNYFDFWNDEKFCVDIENFRPTTQARLGRNTQYVISMRVLSDVIETKTTDTLLSSLQALAWVDDQVEAMIGEFNAGVKFSDSLSAISVGLVMFAGEGLLDSLEVGSTALESVLQVLPGVKSTLTGGAFKTTSLSASRSYSRFVSGL